MGRGFCDRDKRGFTLPRTDAEELDALGARILNGRTRDILIAEDEVSLFVCTSYGTISNEIRLDELKSKSLTVITKGGWRTECYPCIEIG